MTVVNNPSIAKTNLFDSHDVGIHHGDPCYAPLRLLDNKVVGIALKIIQNSALALALVVALGSAVLVGVSSIPVTGVGGLVVVGLICYVVRSHFKKYYNKESLQQHQKEALQLVKVYTYLEGTEGVLGLEKQRFLRPLTHLIERHHHLAAIIKYRILSPEDFKKAFDLEIKHLKPASQVAIYSKVKAAVARSPDYARVMDTPAVWSQMLQNYIRENQALCNVENLMSYDAVKKSALSLKDFFSISSLLMKDNAIIPIDKCAVINECKKRYDQGCKAYNTANGRVGSQISTLEKKIEQLESERDKKYQLHGLHEVVSHEQQQFLKHIEDVQKDREKKLDDLSSNHSINCLAIDSRKVLNPQGELVYESEEDADLYQEYTRRYEIQKSYIEKNCQKDFDDCVGMSMQPDFLNAREQLLAYRQLIEDEYQPKIEKLSSQLNDLKDDIDKESLTPFKGVLIGVFESLRGALAP